MLYDFVLTQDFYERLFWDGRMALTNFIRYLLEIDIKKIAYVENYETAKKLKKAFEKYQITQIDVGCALHYETDRVDDTLYIDNNFYVNAE